jgi:hypothetical protein
VSGRKKNEKLQYGDFAMKRFTQIAVSALIVFAVSAALTSTAFAKGNGSGKSCHNNSCHNSCRDYCYHNYCNNYCYPTCQPLVVLEEPVCQPEVCVTPIYPYTSCYAPSFCSKPYCYKSGNFQKTMHKSMKSH